MLIPLALTGLVLGGLWLYAPRTTQGGDVRPPPEPGPPPGPQPRPRVVTITPALAGTTVLGKIGDLLNVSNSNSNETYDVRYTPGALNEIGVTPQERVGVMTHYHAVGPGTVTITFRDVTRPTPYSPITFVIAPSQ